MDARGPPKPQRNQWDGRVTKNTEELMGWKGHQNLGEPSGWKELPKPQRS